MRSHLLDAGTLFASRYEIVAPLRIGGMGAVYEATDRRTGRRRAIKVLLPHTDADADVRARFAREATVAARVASVHLVEVSDAGIDEATDLPFLAMELLEGADLGAEIESRGALPAREVVEAIGQVARVLDKVHAEGIVHRDLKPANLFLTHRDDGTPCIKLLDFGIAKRVTRTAHAEPTRSLGTPVYMAPEQLTGDGRIGPAADIYALGHLVFTLLVGVAYWEDERREADTLYAFLYKVSRGAREPASKRARRAGIELPPGFDRWFAKATAALPGDRYDSAAALATELERVVDPSVGPSAPTTAQSRWRMRGLAVGAPILAGAIAWMAVASSREPPSEPVAPSTPASAPVVVVAASADMAATGAPVAAAPAASASAPATPPRKAAAVGAPASAKPAPAREPATTAAPSAHAAAAASSADLVEKPPF